MRRTTPLVLTAALFAACSGDDTSNSGADDDAGGAVIVTTTTSAGSASDEAASTTVATPGTPPTSSADAAADTTSPTSAADTAASTTAPSTTAASTSAPPTTARPEVGDPVVTTEVVTTVDQPVDLAVRSPDSDVAYVVGQSGLITRLDLVNGTETTVLDLSGRVSSANEQGLLGLAFSPDGGHAYVNFTDTDGTTTIAEYAVVQNGSLDAASERIVLTVGQPYRNHNAGDLEFGPDGTLYIPLGDGGSGGDPERRASDPTSLLGSLLRIDPTPSGDAPYTIPPDNPFADGPFDGIEGAPEVWAWGLRNPWKIAFDPVDGALWIADVGQNQFEEIDRVSATDRTAGFATDFGWSAFEGTERFNDDVPATDAMVPPVLVYSHADGGCSISGGVPYRGDLIPELEPAYVYSDFCNSTIWALDLAGGRNLTLLEGLDQVTAVRAGPAGELYVLERSGDIHQLVPG